MNHVKSVLSSKPICKYGIFFQNVAGKDPDCKMFLIETPCSWKISKLIADMLYTISCEGNILLFEDVLTFKSIVIHKNWRSHISSVFECVLRPELVPPDNSSVQG